MQRHELINAPARLSDLRGEKLAVALRRRHDENEARWLAVRVPRSLWARLLRRGW